uniref:Uncharacterized protein n=1 Tax=Picea sitchensis TaxID=3332 RepID=B8LRL6_PICSI|nr:unknown [Picea sitchensis]
MAKSVGAKKVVETAPPQIIRIERRNSDKKALDTIFEDRDFLANDVKDEKEQVKACNSNSNSNCSNLPSQSRPRAVAAIVRCAR